MQNIVWETVPKWQWHWIWMIQKESFPYKGRFWSSELSVICIDNSFPAWSFCLILHAPAALLLRWYVKSEVWLLYLLKAICMFAGWMLCHEGRHSILLALFCVVLITSNTATTINITCSLCSQILSPDWKELWWAWKIVSFKELWEFLYVSYFLRLLVFYFQALVFLAEARRVET